MARSESDINAAYIALGVEACWPMRGNLNEVLSVIAGTWTGTGGAGLAYSTTGPESARTGNIATFSGASNSWAKFGTLANVGSRVASGGGLYFGFFFKIPNTVTNWRIGTLNTVTQQYLYYDCTAASANSIVYRRNNVESAYQDGETWTASALRDNTLHHFAATYNHKTGTWRTFIDGEPWSEGSSVANRNTANDALSVNIDNFTFGAYDFNGSPSTNFVSANAELTVAAKCMSDEEVRKICDLGWSTFEMASELPQRVGPRADVLATSLAASLSTESPLIVLLGDSTLTAGGAGDISLPALLRSFDNLSGNRLSNWEIRVGNDSDTNAPPGRVLSIGAGSTQKYLFCTQVNDVYNSNLLIGSDNYNRRSMAIDASMGLSATIGFRKESGGRGPITYVLRGSSILPTSSTLAGSENYQAVIASGTLFTAAELTGDGVDTAYRTISGPATGRYKYYQIELTNTGGSAATLVDLEPNSIANTTGPAVKVCTHGGYKISDFYTNHPNWARMIQNYRTLRGNPPLYIILSCGLNDGQSLSASSWYTALSSFADSIFADFEDAKLYIAIEPPRDAVGAGALYNARMSNFVGAIKAYAEANPTKNICGGNVFDLVRRNLGWSGWSQSLSKLNIIGEYSAATTYTQNQVAWTRTNDLATVKRHWNSRSSQTGASLLNVEKWVEVTRYLNGDGIHHSEIGSLNYVESILTTIAAPGDAESDSTGSVVPNPIGGFAPGATIDSQFRSVGTIDLSDPGYTITVYRNGEATGEVATQGTASAGSLPYTYTLPAEYVANDRGIIVLRNLSGSEVGVQTFWVQAAATIDPSDLTGAVVTIQSPVLDGGEIEVWQGDAYEGSEAIPVRVTGWTRTNLNGKTLTLRFIRRTERGRPAADQTAELESSAVATQSAGNVSCDIELTAEQTGSLTTTSPSDISPNYTYTVRCDELDMTVATGDVIVQRKII